MTAAGFKSVVLLAQHGESAYGTLLWRRAPNNSNERTPMDLLLLLIIVLVILSLAGGAFISPLVLLLLIVVLLLFLGPYRGRRGRI